MVKYWTNNLLTKAAAQNLATFCEIVNHPKTFWNIGSTKTRWSGAEDSEYTKRNLMVRELVLQKSCPARTSSAVMINENMRLMSSKPHPEKDNLHCKGKYQCTADLLFYLHQFSCFAWMNNIFTCLFESKPVKQEVSQTVILPLTK